MNEELMTVVKHVAGWEFQFGGEEHSGWLSAGASVPLPTPIEKVVLDVEIVSEGAGFLLCWNAREGNQCGDLWFQSVDAAEETATEEFGIARTHWKDGPISATH